MAFLPSGDVRELDARQLRRVTKRKVIVCFEPRSPKGGAAFFVRRHSRKVAGGGARAAKRVAADGPICPDCASETRQQARGRGGGCLCRRCPLPLSTPRGRTIWRRQRGLACGSDVARRQTGEPEAVTSPAPEHSVSPLTVWRVLSEARGRCARCGSLAVEGRPSDPRNGAPIQWEHVGRRIGSLEHKRTRDVGGDNDLANLAWCCLWCNTWPRERRPGATDQGGYYPDAHGEPDPKESQAILASKYVAATRRVWSVEQAFAVGPRPEHFFLTSTLKCCRIMNIRRTLPCGETPSGRIAEARARPSSHRRAFSA